MIRVLQRALAVLECFSDAKPRMGLHEISQAISLPKTTTFRILSTLVKAGYLVQLQDQSYGPSYKLMTLASVAQKCLGIRDLAHPVLEKLAAETGETAEISMLDGDHRVCLDAVESTSSLKSIINPGARLPLLYGATGKVLLARMDGVDVDRVVRDQARANEIDNARLKRLLAKIRRQGYAVTSNERVRGATAIAAPVSIFDSQAYCITITGPSGRFEGRQDKLRDLVVDAAAQLSMLLGVWCLERAG
jgi:DNA-binding IclR family transcriptional regulator